MRRRSFAACASVAGALACASLVIACGNLTLESSSGAAPSGGPGDVNDGSNLDASADATFFAADVSDGTSAPAHTSALCNLVPGTDAGQACDPDTDALFFGSATCANQGGAPADGGAPDGGDAGTALACHVTVSGGTRVQTCSAAGRGQDGAGCQSSSDCAPTFECVGTPGRCRHYCCSGDRSCGADAFCDVQTTTATGLSVPVCTPLGKCKVLVPNVCADGQTCAIVKDDGTASCVAVGPAQAGQACDAVHCGDGLTCMGQVGSRVCYKLCRMDQPSDCPAGTRCKGSAQLFDDPNDGMCQ